MGDGAGNLPEVPAVNPDDFPCFKCGGSIDTGGFGEMHDAMRFTSRGGYGSTVWDPVMGEDWLRINVCDRCILEGVAQGTVARGKPRRVSIPVDYELFDPENDCL
jgi:hypothetical protein